MGARRCRLPAGRCPTTTCGTSSRRWRGSRPSIRATSGPIRPPGSGSPMSRLEAVARHYVPEHRLAEIVADPQDPLERETRDLATLLARPRGPAPRGVRRLGLHPPRPPRPGVLRHRPARLRGRQRETAPRRDRRPGRARGWWHCRRSDAPGGAPTPRAASASPRTRWPISTDGAGTTGSSAGATCLSTRRAPTGRSARPTETAATRRSAGRSRRPASPTPTSPCSCRPSTGWPTCAGSREGRARWRRSCPSRASTGGAAPMGERIVVAGHLEAERAGGRRLVVGSGFLPDGGSLRVPAPRSRWPVTSSGAPVARRVPGRALRSIVRCSSFATAAPAPRSRGSSTPRARCATSRAS